jgi:hypothetical protein
MCKFESELSAARAKRLRIGPVGGPTVSFVLSGTSPAVTELYAVAPLQVSLLIRNGVDEFVPASLSLPLPPPLHAPPPSTFD